MNKNDHRFKIFWKEHRSLVRLIKSGFSEQSSYNSEKAKLMREKMVVMKQTLTKTTPRAFAILFMLSTIPSFYFMNNMMEKEYNEPAFTDNSNRIYKYYYLYNFIFYSCGLALTQINYHNPSSKYTIPKTRLLSRYLPLIFSFLGLILPETDSKHLMWPAFLTQFSTTVVEGLMGSQGTLPFWFYSYRHYIGMFYIVLFSMNFIAMGRLNTRRSTHPHQFVEEKIF